MELDNFTKTAEKTNCSQSLVDYDLILLQKRLGMTLLTPEGRRAVLTSAGELLLSQVKPLLKAFLWVETRAATLQNGTRTQLDLMVDDIFPRRRLFAIFEQFRQAWPQTRVRLTEVLGSGDARLAAHANADVMVLTRRQSTTGRGERLIGIDFMAVARRDHLLYMLDAPLNEDALHVWPLIRIADRDNPRQPTHDIWTFSTIDAVIDATMCQVGYSWLPEEHIQTQLDQGPLHSLPPGHDTRHATPLHLIVRDTPTPLDEQVSTLLRLLREH